MNRDITFLVELWSLLSPHVDKSERIHLAQSVVEIFDEYGMADGLEDSDEVTGILAKAVKIYYGHDSVDEEDDE